MTNIEPSHITQSEYQHHSLASNTTNQSGTSPLTDLNTSPHKDPFETQQSSNVELSDSSSELSEINSELETEKMEVPEGSELHAMAEDLIEHMDDVDHHDDADGVDGVDQLSQLDGLDDQLDDLEDQLADADADAEADDQLDEDKIIDKQSDTITNGADDADEDHADGSNGEDGADEEIADEDIADEEEDEEDEEDSVELQRLKEEEEKAKEERRVLELEKQLLRQQAIEELTSIEIEYLKLKDVLYHNQLSRLEYELKLCLEGSHPDFIRILNKVNETYDRKIRTLVMSQNYKLDCINNQTKLTRYQVHQQYLKNCQDLKLESIEETTTKWYEINKERRMMDQIQVNNKKRPRDSENRSILFNEIDKLTKIQRKLGFPSGISNLSSAQDTEIEQDLINMKKALQF